MPSYRPEARHPVDIRFFVDDKSLLSVDFLEITIPEDHFHKRIIKLEPEADGDRAEGLLIATVPDGDLTVITCALVTCLDEEPDLLCGKVTLPSQIAVDRIHEITYSTKHSCNEPAVPAYTFSRSH
jgi:hypothetical protein